MDRARVIIQGFDVMGITKHISQMNKRNEAILLSSIENLIGRDSPHFLAIRKLILDYTNDFSRTIVKDIFGDIDA